MFRRRAPTPSPAPEPDWRSFDGVAETYEETLVPLHEPPVRDLVAAATAPPGGRILDVGTGTGVAAAIAGQADPEALVVGVDRSVPMLRVARAGGIRTVAAEAIDLPFPDSTFDAVVATFVISYFTKYETALFDMLRVLRPRGRLGVTTWGAGEDEFRRAWRETAEEFTGRDLLRDAVRKAAPWETHFSDPDRLAGTLRDVGLREVDVQERDYRIATTIESYLRAREASALGRFLRTTLGEALWKRFRLRVADEFRKRFRDPLGDRVDVLIGVGTKPG
jgi:ubiquinone/menaquinone biosynthesis C-methylase UbiE